MQITHYVALNPVPHCNAYYAYTTLYEHWIAKFGLPEILVTDNGTEFINNEIITLCHLYNIKHKPRTSHAPWTNGLVEGMNRSLQESLRCIINGNDTQTTINENTDLLEYQLNDSTVPCLPLSMILIAFNISHTQNTKGHSGSEKTYSNFTQSFYFPNAPIWIKVLCNDCIVCQLNKPYPNQK